MNRKTSTESVRRYRERHRKCPVYRLSRIFDSQKSNSKNAKRSPPLYTKEQFVERFKNDPKYLSLFNAWVDSGHDKKLVPSFDRIDNLKPYSFDNIEVVSWYENYKREHRERVEGTSSFCKAVLQKTLSGETIKKFPSGAAASRETGVRTSHICEVCKGRRQSAGSFLWSYV